MISFKQYLLTEMPKHYSGDIVYQKDSKFTPLSVRNIYSFDLLGTDRGMIFLIHPSQNIGYIFDEKDLKSGKNFVSPVMHVSFRDTEHGYKQAYNLRIKQSYSQQNLVSDFYKRYVEKFGGIVSDTEHLEGGKKLWQSLIKFAEDNDDFVVEVDGEQVTTSTPVENIWSRDESKKDTVLIFRKK